MSDAPSTTAESEAAFAKSAGRQLLMFGIAAVVIVGATMYALQVLASLVGSDTAAASAINRVDNSISFAMRTEPPNLSTLKATDAQSGIVLGHVMEGLTRMDMQDQLAPGVAERWEVTSNGAKFWLRDNAKWSDGRTVTAHDFAFAWRTVLNPETASRYAFLLYPIKNAREINSGELPIESLGVRTPDDFTLEVDFASPTPFFDKMVTFQTYFPAREDLYVSLDGKYGADADKMYYNGPFELTSWIHGSSLLMDRNPHYWNSERIHLDRINVAYITSDATATLNFFKDEKIAYTTLLAENLGNALEQHWHIKNAQDGTVFYLEFNHVGQRLTRNRNLRRALQLVLDMDELVYKVTKLPGYLPGRSLFPGWLMGVEDKFRREYPAPEPRVDAKLAREHLARAKTELELETWPPLVLLSGDNPVSNIQSEWVQGVLKSKLGLEVKIDKQIFKQRLEKMTAGEFDMVLGGWGPDYDDLLTFGDLFASWNLQNRGKYNNPELDALVAIAQTSTDQAERVRAFAGIQDIIYNDVVILPMYERGVTYVINPELKGVKRRIIGAEVDFTEAYIAPQS